METQFIRLGLQVGKSSIGSAVKRVEDAIKEERDFRTKLKKVERRLKESVNKVRSQQ
jgi:hypothetical protein